MIERRGTDWTKENDEFMERMRELDRRTAMEVQLEREGVNKLNWYRATHKEDKEKLEKLQCEYNSILQEKMDLHNRNADILMANSDLMAERDQLLARVAELEKGIQEGGDLVE